MSLPRGMGTTPPSRGQAPRKGVKSSSMAVTRGRPAERPALTAAYLLSKWQAVTNSAPHGYRGFRSPAVRNGAFQSEIARPTSLLISRNQSTELATAAHSSHSAALKLTVPKAR